MTVKKITQPITIDHVARIEGKAGIEVIVEKESVKEIKVNVFEGPRFFEAITFGKPIAEATAIFPRVCSFCAAAHKITALQAAERALGLTPSKQTAMLRELMYLGDQIESHALHLYLLALPDFLGFPDAFSMGKKYPRAVKTALELKDIGAKIQTDLGSRMMHQENALIGGFGKLPSKNTLTTIASTLKKLFKKSELALQLFLDHELWPEVASERTHLALQPYNDKYGILGTVIKSSDGSSFDDKDYQKNIIESVVPHSFAKHCHYKKKPFMTGAISRITLFKELLTGRAKELAKEHQKFLDPTNPFANNFAQTIELIYFIERAHEVTEEVIEKLTAETPIQPKFGKAGQGIAASEAPRGLLFYSISVDKAGLVKEADIITPTAMFLPLMEQDIKREAEAQLQQGITDPKTISQRIETVVRSYDPCVSCSVHVTGVK